MAPVSSSIYQNVSISQLKSYAESRCQALKGRMHHKLPFWDKRAVADTLTEIVTKSAAEPASSIANAPIYLGRHVYRRRMGEGCNKVWIAERLPTGRAWHLMHGLLGEPSKSLDYTKMTGFATCERARNMPSTPSSQRARVGCCLVSDSRIEITVSASGAGWLKVGSQAYKLGARPKG